MTTNNGNATLDALLADYPFIRERWTLRPSLNKDIITLIALVDALLVEREQAQPDRYTEIEHDTILNHVERMVSEAYAKNLPMYSGQGFEDILKDLFKQERIERHLGTHGYYYTPLGAIRNPYELIYEAIVLHAKTDHPIQWGDLSDNEQSIVLQLINDNRIIERHDTVRGTYYVPASNDGGGDGV